MLLKIHELARHLEQPLKPVYLVSGDEPLQVIETTQTIRDAAKSQGFSEREIHFIDNKFNWPLLLEQSGTMSLFGDKKILDLRLEQLPDKDGQKILNRMLSQLDDMTLILISSPKIPKQKQSLKWFKQLSQLGVYIPVWAIDFAKLPQWLMNRSRNHNRILKPDAAQFLAERVEGNLLAAGQELDKIFFMSSDGDEINLDDVKEQVIDNARFNVWELIDESLKGNFARIPRILDRLQQEKTEPMALAKMIENECLTMEKLSLGLKSGLSMTQVFKQERIWSTKQAIYNNALQRYSYLGWQKLWVKALRLEKIIIGAEKANFWDECLDLLLIIAGFRIWNNNSNAMKSSKNSADNISKMRAALAGK